MVRIQIESQIPIQEAPTKIARQPKTHQPKKWVRAGMNPSTRTHVNRIGHT